MFHIRKRDELRKILALRNIRIFLVYDQLGIIIAVVVEDLIIAQNLRHPKNRINC